MSRPLNEREASPGQSQALAPAPRWAKAELDQALAAAEASRHSGDLARGRQQAALAWQLCQAEAAQGLVDPDRLARAAVLHGWFLYRSSDYGGLLAQHPALFEALGSASPMQVQAHLREAVLAACELGLFDRALRLAQSLQERAASDGRPEARAMALNALAACFERMGDPWQAERMLDDAQALLEPHGPLYERFVTLNNRCAVQIGAHYLLRGASEAGVALEPLKRALPSARRAVRLAGNMPAAHAHAHALGNLGEVLLHLGEATESRDLLAQALDEARRLGLQPQFQRICCSMAEWQLRHGSAEAAREALSHLLGKDPVVLSTRLRAHHAAYQAARRLGQTEEALHHLEAHLALERQRSAQQLRAQSDLFITRVEAETVRRDAEQHRDRVRVLEAEAGLDPLTGLGSRRALDQHLPQVVRSARAGGTRVALVMLDLDHFKQVNDRFGHAVGDQVLGHVARLVRQCLRGGDLVFRLGGDEFLVALPDIGPGAAQEVCERLLDCIADFDWRSIASGLGVTVSLGLAETPTYDEALLTRRADEALYRAKSLGRNQLAVG